MKRCIVCLESKRLEDFYNNKASKDQKQTRCKLCHNQSSASAKALKRKSLSKKEKEKQYGWQRNWHYKKTYGITIADYDRMLEEQGFRCAICEVVKPDKRCVKFHVDHCHTTGKVRGLLCNNCNIGLGKFQDNPQFLVKAADYLND